MLPRQLTPIKDIEGSIQTVPVACFDRLMLRGWVKMLQGFLLSVLKNIEKSFHYIHFKITNCFIRY